MSKRILLISEQLIKSKSIIETNVDGKILSKSIMTVQETHLKGILGATLYNELLDAVELKVLSGTSLNDANTILLNDYVQPYLIYAVISDFIISNTFKITNKGVVKMTDNSAASLNRDELEYMKKHFDNEVAFFKSKLIKYLKENNLIDDNDKPNINHNTSTTAIGWYIK